MKTPSGKTQAGGRLDAFTYRPDSRLQAGFITAMAHIWQELWRHRHHVSTLFGRDFKASYRGTRLGVFWNIVLPLAPIGVYGLLAALKVLPSFEGVPAALAIALNATVWFLLAGAIQSPIQVVARRNNEAMKTSLPLSSTIAASFAKLGFDTLVRLVAFFIILVVLLRLPAPTIALAVLALAIGLLFSLGLGLILAMFNIVVPDVDRIVGIVLQYGLFVSGVIFPLGSIPALSWLEFVNPFALVVSVVRDLTFHGLPHHGVAFSVFTLLTLALFSYAARIFYVMEYRIRGIS